MLKAILMIPIALAAMFATPADATVVYNWRTLSVERGVEMSGRIGFSDEAWLAHRAEVDFLGFAQSPIGSPGEYPRFIYPTEDSEGEADLTPDVVDFSVFFSEMGMGGGVNLVVGENRVSSRLSLEITFDDLGRPSGGFNANSEPASSHFIVVGNATRWTAEYGSDGGCQPRCRTTGIWELDASTVPTRVAEPGSLLLVFSGMIGLGILGRQGAGRLDEQRLDEQHIGGCELADV